MDEEEATRVRRRVARSLQTGEKVGRSVRTIVNFVGEALAFLNIVSKSEEPKPPQLDINIDELFEYQPEGVRNLARHFHDYGPLADDVWEFADVCEHVFDFRRGADALRQVGWRFPSGRQCESVNSFGDQCQRVRCDGVHAAWGNELRIWTEGDYPHRSWLIDTSLWVLHQEALHRSAQSTGKLPEVGVALPLGKPCLVRSFMGFPCEMHNHPQPLHLNLSAGVRERNFLYWKEDGVARFATRRGR